MLHSDDLNTDSHMTFIVSGRRRNRRNTFCVQNGEIMRWRWGVDANGNKVAESNARIVEWSDGSRQVADSSL